MNQVYGGLRQANNPSQGGAYDAPAMSSNTVYQYAITYPITATVLQMKPVINSLYPNACDLSTANLSGLVVQPRYNLPNGIAIYWLAVCK